MDAEIKRELASAIFSTRDCGRGLPGARGLELTFWSGLLVRVKERGLGLLGGISLSKLFTSDMTWKPTDFLTLGGNTGDERAGSSERVRGRCEPSGDA
jgi:hypothetical protein